MALAETPAKKASINWFLCAPGENMAGEKEDQRTGRRFPITPMRSAVHKGIPFAMAKGWPTPAQRGTMEIRKVKIYFIGYAFRLVLFILSYLPVIDNIPTLE